MKRRNGLVRTFVIGALLSSVAWAVPGMQAQAGDLPVKAPAAAEPVPYWWFHGEVEAGGRVFLNNPQRNGSAYLNQSSLAKYYEYSSIKPGPFSNIWLSTGSSDGLYRIDVDGKNIGYSDQWYNLDASKAGEHYFNFQWDQTPHVYSTSAQTPFQGIGTNNLTVTQGAALSAVVPNLYQTDIGIRRDTASANYRWTPTEAWDIKADYSHMSRIGTQADGVLFRTGATNGVEVPKPVDDTTQNFGLNGEYAGTSPWGQKVTAKVGYTGSQYTDNFSSYTIQNPNTGGLNARLVLPPSNNANGFNGTLAADLPLKSRYVGTVSYTMMRQNDAFLPFSLNETAPVTALPASSLNGAINTTLSNNILTTKITSDLTSKLSYRYYDFQNNTPQITFPVWPNRDNTTASTNEEIRTLSISYIKQNAGAQLNWRPLREWNLTAEYGYERYNYTQTDADVTNEHSGKLSADWKPASWLTTRASVYYGNRRYENYDYVNFVRNIQFPTGNGGTPNTDWYYSSAYRQFMFDNRQRTKANFAVDVVVVRGVTITPTFKYQDDNYGINSNNQQGLDDSRSMAAGVDLAYIANPDLSFVFGYMREHYDQSLYGVSSGTFTATTPRNNTSSKSDVDTFTAAMNYAAIPDKLMFDLRYVLSHGVDDTKFNSPTYSVSGIAFPVQFPNDTTWFQRLDATATYKFDKQAVAQMGWKGDVKARLRYTWERNSVSNWQNDPIVPFSASQSATELFMAWDNPNYNVHLLTASLIASW